MLVLCVVAVLIGVFARFDRLDGKLFWQDETYSMIRITGHVEADYDRLFDGTVHPASALRALVQLDPARGYRATVDSLRSEPQRGPLFYFLGRVWANAFGTGVAAMRTYPALVGIAGIGFAFLLGRRLTGDAHGGAIAAALVALSPLEIRFAQQLREYVAIVTLALAASWLYLRTLERASFARSAAYALTMVVGLYVSPLFATVFFAHGITALVAARRDRTAAPFVRWFATIVVSAILFSPWLLANLTVASDQGSDLAWMLEPYSLKSLILKWAFNVGASFFDAEFANVRLGVVIVPVLAIVGIAVWSLLRWPRDSVTRTLAIALPACTAVPLIALDIVKHAHFETAARYQMTTWIGLSIVVALLLARGIVTGGLHARLAIAGMAFFIALGIGSVAVSRNHDVWWDNNEHIDERATGAVIAASPSALVVANPVYEILAIVLSRYVPPRTPMLLYAKNLPVLPAASADPFLFIPAPGVVGTIEREVGPKRVVRNVSPSLGFAIPELRSNAEASADPLRADNALWHVVPRVVP